MNWVKWSKLIKIGESKCTKDMTLRSDRFIRYVKWSHFLNPLAFSGLFENEVPWSSPKSSPVVYHYPPHSNTIFLWVYHVVPHIFIYFHTDTRIILLDLVGSQLYVPCYPCSPHGTTSHIPLVYPWHDEELVIRFLATWPVGKCVPREVCFAR